MKFRILRYSAMTRREIYKSIAKWVLFSLVLLVSYTIEVTMPFASWQPYLTLTTAVAVSFFSEELSGVVFADPASDAQTEPVPYDIEEMFDEMSEAEKHIEFEKPKRRVSHKTVNDE